MIFKYKELEIQLFPELDMKKIRDNMKSFIMNKNIDSTSKVDVLKYANINEADIIIIPETPEEIALLAQEEMNTISSNTNTIISNTNPQINSNINNNSLNDNFIWINKASGELFMCVDPTIDANVWIGQLGTKIRPASFTNIQDDLLFHYSMDSYKGNTLSSSNACEATMKNCKFVDGKIGKCLQFVGNSYITINDFLPNLTGKIEMNLFIYPESFSSRQNIISKSFAGELSVVQEKDGTISFYFGNSGNEGSGQYNVFRTTQSIPLKVWSHLTIKRIDYQTAEIYFGDTLIPTVPFVNTIVSVGASTSPLYIGTGYAGNYIGRMDDFFFHTRNLSTLERQYLISRGE
jgi:hypothetical protein